MLSIERIEVPNGDGWNLSLRRTFDEATLNCSKNPLLIIPGYGMNSFIFGFHPRGTSMEATLAARGFEVWAVDFRGQGQSRCTGGTNKFRLDDLVLKDLFSAVSGVIEHTQSATKTVDMIGCSLGATMMFAYACCISDNHAGRLVSMGGAVRWIKAHPLLKAIASQPKLLSYMPIRGTRRLAKAALPLLPHVPWLLSLYLHPQIVDVSHAANIIQTIENPNRHVNRDIANWIKTGELIVDGRNVGELLPTLRNPLLTVIANSDGIVPRETALWPHMNVGSEVRDLLNVGNYSQPIAHADMFVCDHAPELVFNPLADWLNR
jgi:pimeloyl-ACP methyl ester carboxylesterase